uniref:Orf546 n=1 Tax=Laurentiella strenua TaxID=114681 RepID=A0A2I4PET4_9SPIT|nr:orf546 [Laurentiella strenua]
MFVIVPFYYELTYTISFVFSWWNWYTRVFFFKFISLFTIVILISYLLQLNIKWMNWKKLFFFTLIINIFILYLLYSQFIITFFGYFTDPLWYQKTRVIDYIQLSHEPLKWGWGPAKRDHFTYHKTSTVFWFKNDTPFAGAFLMINLFFFLSIFFLLIYWITLLRRIYATKEVTYTFSTFCISALKQFFYFFFLLYILIFISFIVCYWRFPIEFFWLINSNSWFLHFFLIIKDYFFFLLTIFF